MTARSRAQVDKDAHIRSLGGKVKVAGKAPSALGAQRKIATPKPRSAAQVDKDALARQMGRTVAPRGKFSDAATGRLAGTKLGAFKEDKHPRNPKNGKFRAK